MSDKRVAVVLAGCGSLDGAEIHEAVAPLLALGRAGAKVQCAAPDKPQMHVVDHLIGTAGAFATIGGAHVARGVTERRGDRARKIVAAPSHMYGVERIANAATGIEKAVAATLALA